MAHAPVQDSSCSPQSASGLGTRWLGAVLAGLLVGLPVSVLLSFAGLLPFYLGPFFFLLFGLAVGAAVYRVARVLRPMSPESVLAAAAAVIMPIFAASLVLEYWQLGPHAGKMVAKHTRELPAGTGPREFRAEVARQIDAYLAAEYPPGGAVGYLRWASSNGRFVARVPGAHPPEVKYALSQSPLGWTLRVVVSLGLLIGGVLSQVWPLRRPEPPPRQEPGERPEQAQPAT